MKKTKHALLSGIIGVSALMAGAVMPMNASAADGECMMGEITLFAGSYAPRGYAFAQGQIVRISENQALFSILGNTYGGDGRTIFALPDLRGRVPVGVGAAPGLTPHPLGEMGGYEATRLTVEQMPAHTHEASLQAIASNGDKSDPKGNMLATVVKPGGRKPDVYNGYSSSRSNPVEMSSQSIEVGTAGGTTPVSLMQPYTGLNYIICVEGIYPQRQ